MPRSAEKIIRDEIELVADEWGVTAPSFVWNGRLTRSMGRTKWAGWHIGVGAWAEVEVRGIDFSPEVADWPADAIRELVRHEMAHVVAITLYDDPGHGAIWKEIAEAMGCIPRASVNVSERVAASMKRTGRL